MKTIVVPTDFSKNSLKALDYAVEIANKTNSKLAIVHSYSIPIMGPANAFTSREETMNIAEERIIKEASNQLSKIQDKINPIIPTETFIQDGEPNDVILDILNEVKASLIIMGTHGETGDKSLFYGSITEKVIEEAHCPVLAIPFGFQTKSIDKIVYATDFKFHEAHVFEKIEEFAKIFDSTVIFLHVDDDNAKTTEVELDAFIEKSSYPKIAKFYLPQGHISEQIKDFTNEHEADLLVLNPHTRTLFQKIFEEDVTSSLLKKAELSLLIFSKNYA